MTENKPAEKFVGVDYETYYDAEYGLRTMNTWNYVFDKTRFDAYMVAIHNDDIHYVGPPKDFDWSLIKDHTQVMHNAQFDGLVNLRLIQDGIIPEFIKDCPLVDTADLAAYLKMPRTLAGACEQLLGLKMDKSSRDRMKGKTWKRAVELGMQDEMIKYGGTDAENCYLLWKTFGHLWPASERKLSELNRNACWTGVPLDHELVVKAHSDLEIQLWEARNLIPWDDGNPDGKGILAPTSIRAECAKYDMNCPASFAADSEDAEEWEDRYAEEYPWVKAIRTFRRVNTFLKRVKALKNGGRGDGTFPYQMKYCGAHTGRMSGGGDSGGKFNMTNMPQEEMFGVDIRPMFSAKPGDMRLRADRGPYPALEGRRP
jgi:hypothetical protein